MSSKQRLPWLVVVVLVGALISTVGWALSARRQAPTGQASPAAAVQAAAAHAGHDATATHAHGGTAQDTPPIAPRDGVLAMTVPPLPKTSVNFIWKPEHLVLAAGQKLTLKVANADYMQHNFTFKAAKVAKNLPVDATTTIKLTAPAKPGLYTFYCKYHLQMMEGAVTVR
jgi:plastocyanin